MAIKQPKEKEMKLEFSCISKILKISHNCVAGSKFGNKVAQYTQKISWKQLAKLGYKKRYDSQFEERSKFVKKVLIIAEDNIFNIFNKNV